MLGLCKNTSFQLLINIYSFHNKRTRGGWPYTYNFIKDIGVLAEGGETPPPPKKIYI